MFYCCISMILVGLDSYDLNHPMLLNYIENIEQISGADRASLHKTHLQAHNQGLIPLNNLHWADVVVITEIEVAHVRTESHIL